MEFEERLDIGQERLSIHAAYYPRDTSRVSSAFAGLFPALTSPHVARDTARMSLVVNMEVVRKTLRNSTAGPNKAFSARGLSIAAGLGPDAVRDILRGKSGQAQIDTLAALARALKMELPALIGGDAGAFEVSEPVEVNLPPLASLPRDIPVFGTALGGAEDYHGASDEAVMVAVDQVDLIRGEPIDWFRRTPALEGRKDVFGVFVAGSSMSPRFDDGESVMIDPRRPCKIGDDVLVQLRGPHGHDGEEQIVSVLLKRLVRRSATWIELEQFNPPQRFRVAAEKVSKLYRVMPLSEVVGF